MLTYAYPIPIILIWPWEFSEGFKKWLLAILCKYVRDRIVIELLSHIELKKGYADYLLGSLLRIG